MKEVGTPIQGISVTINDKNFKYIDDTFIDWCESQGYLSVAYDFDLINCLTISTDVQVEFLVHTWKEFSKRGIEFFGTWETPFLNFSNESIVERRYGFCKAIIGKNLSVDSQLNVHLCGYSDCSICKLVDLEEAIQPNGNIYEFINKELIGNKKGICYGCVFEGACNGQCRITTKHPDKVLSQCEFYKK